MFIYSLLGKAATHRLVEFVSVIILADDCTSYCRVNLFIYFNLYIELNVDISYERSSHVSSSKLERAAKDGYLP